jgi:hypothetical protein
VKDIIKNQRNRWHARLLCTVGAVLAACCSAAGQPSQESLIDVTVTPTEATIGEHIQVVIQLSLAEGEAFQPSVIGPELADFEVVSGDWTALDDSEQAGDWRWTGVLAIYETGDFEVPSVRLYVTGRSESEPLESEAVAVTILPVLDQAALATGLVELVEIKPPASITADYQPLYIAMGLLALLLVLAALAWWFHRRYAARLAAVEAPDDPFRRTPPHVWVYAELQKLLERRLPEQGQVELFYGELSHILKRYLSGRYRIKLMETTTADVPQSLSQVGVREASIGATHTVLEGADQVKFAGLKPGPAEWKTVIEEIYRIVDCTKPVASQQASVEGGAA